MITVKTREEFLSTIKEKLPPNPHCIELGVHQGHYSNLILNILEPTCLCLVDPWTPGHDKHGQVEFYPHWGDTPLQTAYSTNLDLDYVCRRFKSEIEEARVIVYKSFSYDAIYSFRDKSFDFIYIDACHIYEAVLWDLENYLPKLRAGGMLCGHDYVDHPSFGVIRAVDEFCEKYGFEMCILNTTFHFGGDWALIPKQQALPDRT